MSSLNEMSQTCRFQIKQMQKFIWRAGSGKKNYPFPGTAGMGIIWGNCKLSCECCTAVELPSG